MNAPGQYLQPSPLQPAASSAFLAALLQHLGTIGAQQPLQHVGSMALNDNQPAPVNAGQVAAGTAAPVYAGQPQSRLGAFLAALNGASLFGGPPAGSHPMHHAAPRLQSANPNIYGDHGYTHPVSGIHAVAGHAGDGTPRSGFYTPSDAPGWLLHFIASLPHHAANSGARPTVEYLGRH